MEITAKLNNSLSIWIDASSGYQYLRLFSLVGTRGEAIMLQDKSINEAIQLATGNQLPVEHRPVVARLSSNSHCHETYQYAALQWNICWR
jgi:hypothetical protein